MNAYIPNSACTAVVEPSGDPQTSGRRAPMAAAPIVYNEDQTIAWDRMWTTFCVLATAGGPPHRGTLLCAEREADVNDPGYVAATQEIIRGIRLVSGLDPRASSPGWIAVECQSAAQARWLSEQINAENVESRWNGRRCFVPAGANFAPKGEVKNVVTAVAKTTHYWTEHLATEVKQTLYLEAAGKMLLRWLKREGNRV